MLGISTASKNRAGLTSCAFALLVAIAIVVTAATAAPTTALADGPPSATSIAPTASEAQAASASPAMQPGDEGTAPGIEQAASTEESVNSFRARYGDRLEAGIFLGGHIFSNDNELGVADVSDADSPANAGIGGVRVAFEVMPRIAVEGEVAIMPTESRDSGTDVTAWGFRLQAVYSFADRGATWIPFAAAGTSWLASSARNDGRLRNDTDWVVLHGGGGIKYQLSQRTGLRADARLFLPPSSASGALTADFEITVGLFTNFGASESAPAPRPEPPRPEPPKADLDPDKDGIVGDADKCPNEPEDADGFQDEDGCPDSDNDGDGVLDAQDRCPDKQESKNGLDDDDGCPETDDDEDGLFGSADKCPGDPEDMDGFEDKDGCPDLDNDKDSVPDIIDQCPLKPETANGFKDDDGCPDVLPKKVARFTGAIKGIRFKTNKATLRRSSYKVLNAAAKVLKEFPALKVEIQGHTDSVGDDAKNKSLSERRAAAVKAYLVRRGIIAPRLTTVGFGETKPVENNKTKKGRAANRRVEFKLVQ